MSTYFQALRERVKGYKTMIFHAAYGVPGSLYFLYCEFRAEGVDISPFVPAKYVAATLSVIAVVGVILRIVTTGPLGSKEGLPDVDTKDPLDVKGAL